MEQSERGEEEEIRWSIVRRTRGKGSQREEMWGKEERV